MTSKLEFSHFLLRFVLFAAKTIVVIYLVLDAIFAPILRPVYSWLIKLHAIIRFQEAVAALPAYGILVALAVPFAFAEPAKLVALYLIAIGHLRTGVALTIAAHLVTLVIVERIYHAGREKLRTIVWFARVMDWLIGVRNRFLAWARSTWVWAFAGEVRHRAGVIAGKLRHQLRFR